MHIFRKFNIEIIAFLRLSLRNNIRNAMLYYIYYEIQNNKRHPYVFCADIDYTI